MVKGYRRGGGANSDKLPSLFAEFVEFMIDFFVVGLVRIPEPLFL
jgi:hypothetical protein